MALLLAGLRMLYPLPQAVKNGSWIEDPSGEKLRRPDQTQCPGSCACILPPGRRGAGNSGAAELSYPRSKASRIFAVSFI